MVLVEINGHWEEEITKGDRIVKKILHRLISEESIKIKKCLDRIGYLNHQSQSFSKMYPTIQDNVRNDMFNLMLENGWNDWVKEVKEELKEAITSKS